jgi:hypothetical protein
MVELNPGKSGHYFPTIAIIKKPTAKIFANFNPQYGAIIMAKNENTQLFRMQKPVSVSEIWLK